MLADIDVKHSAPLGQPRAIEDEAYDTLHRGLADALIVSGAGTGRATDIGQVKKVKYALREPPGAAVLVGSGVDARSVGHFLALADGVIVGSSLKRDGVTSNPVEPQRVKELMANAR